MPTSRRPFTFRIQSPSLDVDALCATPTTAALPLAGWCPRPEVAPIAPAPDPANDPSNAATPAHPAPGKVRDRSGDRHRHRAGLTTRAIARRAGADALPWAWSLDVRATPTVLHRALADALGGTARASRDGAATLIHAPAYSDPEGPQHGAATGVGGAWLVTHAAAESTATAGDAEVRTRALRITSPVLRGPLAPLPTSAGGTAPHTPALVSGACRAPVGGSAGPQPFGAHTSALPGVQRLLTALRTNPGVRVAPDAVLSVTFGVAGATPRQLANLAALFYTAGPYLDAAMRGLDAEAYRRDRTTRTRAPAVPQEGPVGAPEGAGGGVEARTAPQAPHGAPAARRASIRTQLGFTPAAAEGAVASPALVRPVPAAAAEALRALATGAGRAATAPLTPEYAARVAEAWATALTQSEGANPLPCMVDLGAITRGVVTVRVAATLNPVEFAAWVESLALLVARALAQPRMSFGVASNTPESQGGVTHAARIAQGLRRILHDAGLVGTSGPCAVARAWMLHRILGPVESTPARRLRGAAKPTRKRARGAASQPTGAPSRKRRSAKGGAAPCAGAGDGTPEVLDA